MGEKKNRERFSIKFNENDPAHDTVIRLLEKQGPHSKAQFIVNAILHYINCRETPDIFLSQAADRETIEEIVIEILNRNGDEYKKKIHVVNAGTEEKEEKPFSETPQDLNEEEMQKKVNPDTLALIADTMSAFRNN